MDPIQKLENEFDKFKRDIDFKLEKMHKDHMHSINNMKNQLNGVLKAYNEKCDENEELVKKMDRIIFMLEGDEKAKIKGFIERLIAIEDFKKFIDNKKTWVLGWIMGISAAGGFLLFIKKIYQLLVQFYNK